MTTASWPGRSDLWSIGADLALPHTVSEMADKDAYWGQDQPEPVGLQQALADLGASGRPRDPEKRNHRYYRR